MFYYEVLVGDASFHGSKPLTYSYDQKLKIGAVVRISLKDRSALGIIAREVTKPTFTTKPVSASSTGISVPKETLSMISWLASYYPAPFGAIVRQFLPPNTVFPKKIEPAESQRPTPISLPPLTEDQERAIQLVNQSGSHLLRGITGSGKTRVYLEITKRALMEGKSILVLVPEIGLTEHVAKAFDALAVSPIVMHSQLTVAQRRDIWYAIARNNDPQIIIGPRSALFAPIKNIGAIIMDESHDGAYKSETTPHYRSDRVAAVLAKLHKATFLAGSATPNIEDYYAFESKKLPIIKLDKTALTNPETSVLMVDMKDRSNLSQSSILSSPLIKGIAGALAKGEQALLFLNRRGTANAVLCSSCGWRATCTHCDLPLRYHADQHLLRCHTCGRSSKLPTGCPDCGNGDIVLKSMGTKAITEEVTRLFPNARVERFDTDTEKAKSLRHQLDSLKSGEIDILVGTQMVVKGLDLPNLAVVGALDADNSLLIPDFSASERTFQLISQVVGRVGRGHRPGKVFIQTYNPDHPTLLAASEQNFAKFYSDEIKERKTYNFPPFCFLAKLSCLRASSSSAEKAALKLKSEIEEKYHGVTIEGPAPSFHPKESGKYKWQLVVKTPTRQPLIDIVNHLPSGWQHNLDPIDLL